MNDQELEFVSSLFHDATPAERRDLINVMPNEILHKYYFKHFIPKQTGGHRVIYEPNSTLKKVQRRINNGILKKIQISDYAFAYVSGRNILSNARPHVGNPILLKLDIHHFFDNIHFDSVFGIFRNEGHSIEFSRLIAGLVTIDDFLPQGAPTSPAISNIYLKKFDEEIGEYCKKNNIVYTRYSDDLTFSMQHFDPDLVKVVKEKLKALNLELNKKKSKIFSGPLQKRVTGIVVNEKPQVPTDFRRKIRQEMHYILKYGLDEHLERKEIDDAGVYTKSLLGRIDFVLQINKDDEEFKKYKKILSDYVFGDLRARFNNSLD